MHLRLNALLPVRGPLAAHTIDTMQVCSIACSAACAARCAAWRGVATPTGVHPQKVSYLPEICSTSIYTNHAPSALQLLLHPRPSRISIQYSRFTHSKGHRWYFCLLLRKRPGRPRRLERGRASLVTSCPRAWVSFWATPWATWAARRRPLRRPPLPFAAARSAS